MKLLSKLFSLTTDYLLPATARSAGFAPIIIAIAIAVVAAIPITVALVNQQQDIRQRASGNVENGNVCEEDSVCKSEICVKGICTSGDPGAKCEDDPDCRNSACVANVCQTKRNGALCEGNDDCNSGYCINMKRVERTEFTRGECTDRLIGNKCEDDKHCFNKRCVQNICRRGDPGDPCEKSTDCADNQCGHDGKCQGESATPTKTPTKTPTPKPTGKVIRNITRTPTPTLSVGCPGGYSCVSGGTTCTTESTEAGLACKNNLGTAAFCCKREVASIPTATPTTPASRGVIPTTAPKAPTPTPTLTLEEELSKQFCANNNGIKEYLGYRCNGYTLGDTRACTSPLTAASYTDVFLCNDNTTQFYSCLTEKCRLTNGCTTRTDLWCPAAPTPEPSPITGGGGGSTRKQLGDTCNADSECVTNTCMYAVRSTTTKYCVTNTMYRWCEGKGEVTGRVLDNCPAN